MSSSFSFFPIIVTKCEARAKYVVLRGEARRAAGDDAAYSPGVSKADVARRHGEEKMERDRQSVEELEVKLGIQERWTVDSPKWVSTTRDIKERKFQVALNALELLVVQRIFELTKMNRSQTGESKSVLIK